MAWQECHDEIQELKEMADELKAELSHERAAAVKARDEAAVEAARMRGELKAAASKAVALEEETQRQVLHTSKGGFCCEVQFTPGL